MEGSSVEAYMTVNSENQWSCTLCYKSFFDKATTRRHMKTVHMEHQEITCPCCHNKYKNLTVLKVHMRQKHPGYVIDSY